MEVRELPIKAMVELSAPSGETLRRKGTTGTPGVAKCVVAATDVEMWESVADSVVVEAIESERREMEYRTEVANLIHRRYTADDEAAILRKRIALVSSETEDEDVLNEFQEYNSYAEKCKKEARVAVYGCPINES